MHQISLEEATAHIASVLADVLHGEEIVITDHEKPVAKVIPLEQNTAKERVFGSGKGIITYVAEDFDEPLEDLSLTQGNSIGAKTCSL
ncbi:MAG TPA: type II toxin-antitoxin system prevent-host-death family antitoxin [Candidatus Kapabacteria bacterium]|nr:type II toxin-antitoxin system prevent-host-death family antitoxin [Candidatus Kapabacteria bacterium]